MKQGMYRGGQVRRRWRRGKELKIVHVVSAGPTNEVGFHMESGRTDDDVGAAADTAVEDELDLAEQLRGILAYLEKQFERRRRT